MIRITDTLLLDPDEITESFERASGPGGQNVNKVSTAVRLRFDAAASPSLPADVKARLRRVAGSRMTSDGVITLFVQDSRSQIRNREIAVERLVELIRQAAHRPKKRVATRPTLASKRRRVDAKTKRGAVKANRGKPSLD